VDVAVCGWLSEHLAQVLEFARARIWPPVNGVMLSLRKTRDTTESDIDLPFATGQPSHFANFGVNAAA